jgi:hypothetical protein
MMPDSVCTRRRLCGTTFSVGTPAILFTIYSYGFRRGLRKLSVEIHTGFSSDDHFSSIDNKLDAIHEEMTRNLRLYGLKPHIDF